MLRVEIHGQLMSKSGVHSNKRSRLSPSAAHDVFLQPSPDRELHLKPWNLSQKCGLTQSKQQRGLMSQYCWAHRNLSSAWHCLQVKEIPCWLHSSVTGQSAIIVSGAKGRDVLVSVIWWINGNVNLSVGKSRGVFSVFSASALFDWWMNESAAGIGARCSGFLKPVN